MKQSVQILSINDLQPETIRNTPIVEQGDLLLVVYCSEKEHTHLSFSIEDR